MDGDEAAKGYALSKRSREPKTSAPRETAVAVVELASNGLHLKVQVQKIAEEDWLLAVLASTSKSQDSAKMVALGAPSLAEVAHIARRAFVDGVCDERGSPA